MPDPLEAVNPDPAHDTPEILPPVEPPSAGFLMQLFVIPLVIVGGIVMFGLLITWLARRGTDPDKLFDELNRGNAGSWQKAIDVASLLTDPRNSELRKSQKIATKLEQMLVEELSEGDLRKKRIELRVYLCSALGRMESKGNVDVLAEAALREKDIREIQVRIAAVVAIARRIESDSISRESVRKSQLVMNALIEASNTSSDEKERRIPYGLLRESAAYALGVVGGQDANEQLARLLRDPRPTVRFNAAAGLARNGDPRCVDRLLEMLDLDLDLHDTEGRPADQATRNEILRTAIVASFEMLKAEPSFPESDLLRSTLKNIGEASNVLKSVKLLVKNGFNELDRR